MSMHVYGLRDRTSPAHLQKVAVLKACQEAGVQLPKELDDYFKVDGRKLECVSPDDAITIPLRTPVTSPYVAHSETGYDVDLDKIPQGVKTIRFCNSW